jgi:hypothetical protein
MNNELERIWKEAVVAYPSIFLQGLGNSTETSVRMAVSCRNSNRESTECKSSLVDYRFSA